MINTDGIPSFTTTPARPTRKEHPQPSIVTASHTGHQHHRHSTGDPTVATNASALHRTLTSSQLTRPLVNTYQWKQPSQLADDFGSESSDDSDDDDGSSSTSSKRSREGSVSAVALDNNVVVRNNIMRGGFVQRVRTIGWKKGNALAAADDLTRNKAECIALAEMIEALLRTFPQGYDLNDSEALSIALRRFESVILAESTGSWAHAEVLAFNPSAASCLPAQTLKHLTQRMKVNEKLAPASTSLSSSSSSHSSKGRSNGGGGRRGGGGGGFNKRHKGNNAGASSSSSTAGGGGQKQ